MDMAHRRTQALVFLLIVFQEGLSEMIQTQDAVRTTVGKDARFTCLLTQSKNVLQVTWQIMLPGGTENVATCNKRFGTKINAPFQGKVEFEDTGLQNSTIVVRNVTKADQRCYRCLFNAYPEGAIFRKTCLTVDEQPEPILHITKPNGTELMAVSCSAVSHPAPTITLELPRHVGFSNYTTVHAAAANGTITVTSTVTLERFFSNGTQVHCVVHFYSGLVKEASRVIYSDKQDVFEKSEADQSSFINMVIFAAAAAAVGVSVIIMVGVILRTRCGLTTARLPRTSTVNSMTSVL